MTTSDAEQTKAAAFFTGILTLCAGGAGFLIAGLVLGFDYLLHGEPHERETLARQREQHRRDRYAEALAWLEADRADRARTRAAKRAWFEADRDTRGEPPSSGETVGRVFARMWNAALVGGHRFAAGWKAGRAEARTRRAAGDQRWWRPGVPSHLNEWFCPGCNRPMSAPRNERMTGEQLWCDTCRPRQFPPPGPGTPDAPAGQRPEEAAPPDDIQDAVIVPDDQLPADRDVVKVGADIPAGADPAMGGYRQRLDELQTEVSRNGATRNDNPSPPASALR